MSDAKKQDLRHAKLGAAKRAAIIAQEALKQPTVLTVSSAAGAIHLNTSTTTRFPLPLTIGSVVIGAIGALMAMRGHRMIGFGLVIVGGVGLGAAAAAPELQTELAKVTGQ